MATADNRVTIAQEILDRRVLEVCDAIGEFIEYWGFKSIHGRVWAMLALGQGRLRKFVAQNWGEPLVDEQRDR